MVIDWRSFTHKQDCIKVYQCLWLSHETTYYSHIDMVSLTNVRQMMWQCDAHDLPMGHYCELPVHSLPFLHCRLVYLQQTWIGGRWSLRRGWLMPWLPLTAGRDFWQVSYDIMWSCWIRLTFEVQCSTFASSITTDWRRPQPASSLMFVTLYFFIYVIWIVTTSPQDFVDDE